ncbi:MAG: crossover junction endodeoxyribonuclease RuvC [Candidatus Omnitrophica bacterium CG07_land_8_20_14_0_80_42_15]|uniref:Crossover junction endodeoxyribonuclease RuvC n=1 Tax=Candidatus Aquitaenariimonas noxiae TaxID=1974741 RepID=A0A2J0KXC7_9BACT|nr:MAG: crossover junction endodeoxyribonuclease RuvC [Candidatus Omnitrophica bacterium CG07_land_8_20_14_0_80_42_15]
MSILGVDPGLQVTGYGLVENKGRSFKLIEAGVLKTSHKDKIEIRLEKIRRALAEIVKEHKPKVLILEKLYSHYKHPVTAILMGHARGVICLTAGECNIPVVSYPPKRVRKAIAGNGNASKYQIQRIVQDLLKLNTPIKYTDVSDALALAIAHVYMEKKI